MQRLSAGVLALAACGLIAVGCGDDSSTSTTSSSTDASAPDKIDAAVDSCVSKAQDLGGAAGSTLSTACTSIGETVKQALSAGGDQVDAALAQASKNCDTVISQLPEGDAQDALSEMCDAIGATS
jgi:hypothetical protein